MTKFRPLPSQQELHRLFDYSLVTGALYRKDDPTNRAGGLNTIGYRTINIENVRLLEHRVIYKWVTGVDPAEKEVDHINNVGDCNGWHNLRLGSHEQNSYNNPKKKGYCFDKQTGKWRATITVNGKQRSLGRHATEKQARAAYEKASRELHGEFSPL